MKGKQVTVGVTAVKLSSAEGDTREGHAIAILEASADIFLGDATVTNSGGTKGAKLAAGKSASFDLISGDDLYAVAGAAGVTVEVVETGV